MSGKKNAAYLNWRYRDCGTEEYKFFCLRSPDKHILKGYIVYSIRDNVVTVWDCCVEDPACLRRTMIMFSQMCRRLNAEAISMTFVGIDRRWEAQLKHALFFRTTTSRSLMILTDEELEHSCGEILRDEKNWFMWDGDMDL